MFAFTAFDAPPVGPQGLRVNRKSCMALWATKYHSEFRKVAQRATHPYAPRDSAMSMGISGKWTHTARAKISSPAICVSEDAPGGVYTVFTEAW